MPKDSYTGSRPQGPDATLHVERIGTRRIRDANPALPPLASSPVLSMGAAIDAAAAGKLGDGTTHVVQGAGKLRKLLVIYLGPDVDLHRIALDLDFFGALVGTRRVVDCPSPYVSALSFAKDRSRARAILGRYIAYLGLAEAPAKPLLGNHEECLSAFKAAHWAGEINLGTKHQKLISVRRVLRIAAVDDRPVHELTRHWFVTALESASKTVDRTALRDCATLFDRARSIASLTPLLPLAPISPLPVQSKIRRSDHSSIPLRLRMEIDTLLYKRQTDGDPPEVLRRLGVLRADKTIMGERMALNWYVQILHALALLRPSDDVGLSDVARLDWLDRAAKAEVRGEGPWRPLAAATLFDYASSVERCLGEYDPNLKGFATRLKRTNTFFRGIREMTPQHQAACLLFVRSKTLQKRYFEIPKSIFEQAKAGFDRWAVASEHERTGALNHAIVAVVASIVTAVPLRRGSLLKLTLAGSEPNLALRPGMIEINVESHNVKNRKAIGRRILDRRTHSPSEIIAWFAEKPRRALLRTTDDGPDADRLLCGMKPDRLSRIWHSIMKQHGFSVHLHFTRHLMASYLLHLDANALPMVAASLGIRPRTAERFYAFVHSEAHAQRADAMLDTALNLLFTDPDADLNPNIDPKAPK